MSLSQEDDMVIEESSFEDLFKDAWRLNLQEVERSRALLKGWTVGDLVKSYIDALQKAIEEPNTEARSLGDLSIDALVQGLSKSEDVDSQVRIVSESLPWPILQRLVMSGRLSYLEIKKILEYCPFPEGCLDIDLAIAEHTRYARSSCSNSDNTQHLLTQDDLGTILKPYTYTTGAGVLMLVRRRPPPGGFEAFDNYRQRRLRVLTSRDQCQNALQGYTACCWLHGLDWSNVAMVGSAVLTGIQPPETEPQDQIKKPISLYIYGLSREEASRKLQHIANVLDNNRQTEYWAITKNLEWTLFSWRTNMRVKVYRYCPNTLSEVLSSVPLDAHALAFDGQDILLSARSARAIETGYSTFTTDMAYAGGYSTRSSILYRIIEAADDGYGLRFLPSYVESLNKGTRNNSGLRHLKRVNAVAVQWIRHYEHYRALNQIQPRDDPPLSFTDLLNNIRQKKKVLPGLKNVVDQGWYPTAASEATNFRTLMAYHELWLNSHHYRPARKLFERDEIEVTFDHFLAPAIQTRLFGAVGAVGTDIDRRQYYQYLTRRIRWFQRSNDLESNRNFQITYPLVTPSDAEAYMKSHWDNRSSDSGLDANSFLIPVHDPSKWNQTGTQNLPSLLDTTSNDIGNLRYLVMRDRLFWKGQDKVQDIILDLLLCFVEHSRDIAGLSADSLVLQHFQADCPMLLEKICCHVRRAMYRHAPFPLDKRPTNSRERTERDELALFRAWALADFLPLPLTGRNHFPPQMADFDPELIGEETYWSAEDEAAAGVRSDEPYAWIPYEEGELEEPESEEGDEGEQYDDEDEGEE